MTEVIFDIPESGYAKLPYGTLGEGWFVRPPGTPIAVCLWNWNIEEHDDGTISVTPSIEYGLPGEPYYWHGFLKHGVWTHV